MNAVPVLNLLKEEPPPAELIEFELEDRPDVTVGTTVDLDDLLGPDSEISGRAQIHPYAPAEAKTVSLEEVKTGDYKPEQDRENVRGLLALSLVAILAFIVLGSFISLWTGWDGSRQAANDQGAQGFARVALAQEETSSEGTSGTGTQEPTPPAENPTTDLPTPVVAVPSQQTGLAILLQMLLSPIIGLVGAATGFYFGGLSGKAS